MALRGSYITACSEYWLSKGTPILLTISWSYYVPSDKKYHVEHFTCSLCSTLFGPQDSYYEHDGDVYCHFHYSSRFATKCAGCSTAILKQFVEINRNMRDECWHPECYMINKFWNVKVVSRRPTSIEGEPEEPDYVEEERKETPLSLKEKQIRMEQQVYRIWTCVHQVYFYPETKLMLCTAFYQRLRNPVQLASRTCFGKSAMANTLMQYGWPRSLSYM